MPSVSVIMPYYKSLEFLSQSINSICNQTFTDFELILICECGTTIEEQEILETFPALDSRIKIMYNTSFLGISASLNRGIRHASGEYIARMDADDIAREDRLEKQVAVLKQNPMITVCGSNVLFLNKNGDITQNKDIFPKTGDEIAASLLFYCCLRHPTIMMRKSFIVENGYYYNESFQASEDFELWNRLAFVTKFLVIDEPLLYYRWYQGNATHRLSDQGLTNNLKVIQSGFERLGLNFSHDEIECLYPFSRHLTFKDWKRKTKLIENAHEKILDKNNENKIFNEHALRFVLSEFTYWKGHRGRLFCALFLRLVAGNKKNFFATCANYLELYGFRNTFWKIVN